MKEAGLEECCEVKNIVVWKGKKRFIGTTGQRFQAPNSGSDQWSLKHSDQFLSANGSLQKHMRNVQFVTLSDSATWPRYRQPVLCFSSMSLILTSFCSVVSIDILDSPTSMKFAGAQKQIKAQTSRMHIKRSTVLAKVRDHEMAMRFLHFKVVTSKCEVSCGKSPNGRRQNYSRVMQACF